MKPPRFYRTFDYDKSLLPNSYLRTLEENVETIEEAETKTGWTIGYPGWGLLYYILLSHLDPEKHNHILETGTNIGCSTIIAAQAVADSPGTGHIHTIELEQNFSDQAADNIRKAGLEDYVTRYVGDSTQILKTLLPEIAPVRVAFLDASHLHDDAMQEFDLLYPHLDETGVVVFDNTWQIAEESEDQRVHGVLKTIRKKYGGNIVNLEFVSWYTPGLAIWQR